MTTIAALLAGLLLVGDEESPQVIRLKVGTEVVGVIVPDGFIESKGVRIRRVDDDSILDIGFDQMLPEDARRIRGQHGYLPDEPDPILVDAMKVTFLDGSELTGIIVEQGTETFKLRRGVNTQELKRATVRMIEPVKVDALEVYDAEELYGRELAAKSPTTALDHYNLALYCESLQLWAHAKEELGHVTELDPSFKAEIVAAKLKQYDRRMEAGEDQELIMRASRMVRRDDYNGALALLDDFLQKKPNSVLRADAEKARARIEKARQQWLDEQVIIDFFAALERGVRKVATDPKATAKDARKAVELEATKNALDQTAKWLKAPLAEVQKIWENPKRQTVSPHSGSYGSGTWTLGLEAALKGLVQEDPNKKKDDGKAAAKEQSLEDRIKETLEKKRKEQEEAQKRAKDKGKQQGSGKQPKQAPVGPQVYDIPPKEDEWWPTLTGDEKTQYLLAWWAEHEPNLKIIRYDSLACGMCAGVGMIRYFNSDGQEAAKPCTRCKGLGFDRIIRFH
jgi:tetratricopeptide (TPR) repeat protein